MAESLRGGLSLGLSGFGFWSHDIGGYQNTAPAHIYKRWCAFGLMSSHSRLHGFTSYRVPWAYDEEAVDVLRHFVKLKCRLMPYLFDAACEAREKGLPMLRAMLLEFPDDPATEMLDRQYMLGSSLLVAPVFSEAGDVLVYLPDGKWTHILSGETVDGGRWRRETHGFLSLPVYQRPNTLIAWGPRDDKPDYDYADGVVFSLGEIDDGASATATVRDARGAEVLTVRVRRHGDTIEAETAKGSGAWGLRLPASLKTASGKPAVVTVSGSATIRI
jgi:alpha-D-xyloside xylohydrolase